MSPPPPWGRSQDGTARKSGMRRKEKASCQIPSPGPAISKLLQMIILNNYTSILETFFSDLIKWSGRQYHNIRRVIKLGVEITLWIIILLTFRFSRHIPICLIGPASWIIHAKSNLAPSFQSQGWKCLSSQRSPRCPALFPQRYLRLQY